MKIQVSRSVLNGFRRRALKKYPNEHLETVWGSVANDAIRIVTFYQIEHIGTPDRCSYSPEDVEDQQEKDTDFPNGRLKFLGTIHSHPDGDEWPSEADWETSRAEGEVVMGIFQILPQRNSAKKKTKVCFYADPLQELEVL